MGGKQSVRRKPKQAGGEHVNSTKKRRAEPSRDLNPEPSCWEATELTTAFIIIKWDWKGKLLFSICHINAIKWPSEAQVTCRWEDLSKHWCCWRWSVNLLTAGSREGPGAGGLKQPVKLLLIQNVAVYMMQISSWCQDEIQNLRISFVPIVELSLLNNKNNIIILLLLCMYICMLCYYYYIWPVLQTFYWYFFDLI